MPNLTTKQFRGLSLGVLLVGLFLRFYKLDFSPPGLFPDQAINGLEAIYSTLQVQHSHWGNNIEALYILLLKIAFLLFGDTKSTIHYLSATIGIATIPLLIYVVGKIEGKLTGLLAGIFIATSSWHIVVSRSGERYVLIPLILALILWQLNNWHRQRRIINLILISGLISLGFYTYSAYKVMLLILPVGIYYTIQHYKLSAKEILVSLTAGLAVALPLLTYVVTNFDQYNSRMTEISILSNHPLAEVPKLIILQIMSLFTGLFISGTSTRLFNFGPDPFFTSLVALLFGYGLLITIINSMSNNDRSKKTKLYLYSLVAAIAPTILTYEPGVSAAHGGRLTFFFPIAYLIAAIGGRELFNSAGRLISRNYTKLQTALLVAIIIYLGIGTFSSMNSMFGSAQEANDYRHDLYLIGNLLKQNSKLREHKQRGSNFYLIDQEFMRFSLDFYLHDDSLYNQGTQQLNKTNENYSPVYMDFGRIDEYNKDNIELKTNDIIILPAFSALEDQGYITLHTLLTRYPQINLIYKSEILAPEDNARPMFKIYQL
ncbi:MAG: glycosyltransferase family 39 protein [bacterium]|nr:glycosyltransferase family 39 protein [bacterium]